MTRHNDRRLRTDRTRRSATAHLDDHRHPPRRLPHRHWGHRFDPAPPPYIADHVQLGYARTINAPKAAPSTLASSTTKARSLRALYVGISRGCERTTSTTAPSAPTPAEIYSSSHLTDRIDPPAHVRRAELNQPTSTTPASRRHHLRRLIRQRPRPHHHPATCHRRPYADSPNNHVHHDTTSTGNCHD